ncbi:uncharacterized protein LA080_009319 [Diaporthe eres]|nr:uncharacterized protein LA080_009319 [Diaporthe eres]
MLSYNLVIWEEIKQIFKTSNNEMNNVACVCGGFGHTPAECTSKCYQCGGLGHLKRQCANTVQNNKRGRDEDTIINADPEPPTKKAKVEPEEEPEEAPRPAKGTLAYFQQEIAENTKTLINLVDKRKDLEAQLLAIKSQTEALKKEMAALPQEKTTEEEVAALLKDDEEEAEEEQRDVVSAAAFGIHSLNGPRFKRNILIIALGELLSHGAWPLRSLHEAVSSPLEFEHLQQDTMCLQVDFMHSLALLNCDSFVARIYLRTNDHLYLSISITMYTVFTKICQHGRPRKLHINSGASRSMHSA